ncbi:MAG: fibronectin type III domain-containing protein [Bacteroides sp.]|nr:fibronectin type III domain-containing protein [Bacteroides sp.]
MNKTITKIALLLLMTVGLTTGCEENNEPQSYMPTLVSNTVQEADVTRFEASLSGTVVANANSTTDYEVFFLFSKGATLSDATEMEATPDNSSEGRYTCYLSGLQLGTSYSFCIAARSGGSVAQGEVISFKTLESAIPTLNSTRGDAPTETSVTLSSDITDDGGSTINEWGFVYKVYTDGVSEPTIYDKKRVVRQDEESLTALIEGLQANTQYVARAYATNKAGTGYGEAIYFTTEQLKIPQLTCESSNITAFAASVAANITTDCGFKVTEYGFCYSEESLVPTTENLKITMGTDGNTASFQKTIDNLEPNTKFYLRAYAINEKGTGYSNIVEFTTEKKQEVTLTIPTTTNLDVTSVTLASSITIPEGEEIAITEKGICYSMFATRPTTGDSKASDSSEGEAISVSLSNLSEGATYYATAYAVTRDGTFYSDPIQFTLNRTTTATLKIASISNVGETSATINASISSDGGREVTARGICWSKSLSTPTLDNCDGSIASEATTADFAVNLSNLEKGQKYYVRAYATNKNGTAYSYAEEFTTALTKEPEVVNLSVTAYDDHASVGAVISDNGGLEITERGFLISTSIVNPEVGAEGVTKIVSTSTESNFTAELTGLTYRTLYYIRAYATNSKGTGYGQASTFRTSSTTTPSTSISVPDSTVYSTSAIMYGKVNADGGDGSEVLTISEVGFCWSESTSEPTLENCDGFVTGTLNSDNSFTVNASGLKAYTYYYVRAYAINKNGAGYSSYTTLRTKQTDPGSNDNPLPGTEE